MIKFIGFFHFKEVFIMLNIQSERQALAYAKAIEKYFNNSFACECIAINNYISFQAIYELEKIQDSKLLTKIQSKLEFELQSQISIERKYNKLSISIISKDNLIIPFDFLIKLDKQIRGNQALKGLKIPCGLDIKGNLIYLDFDNCKENLFVCGSSRQGKSASLLYIIANFLLKNKNIELVLMDCFKKKFRIFEKLNNVRVCNTINDINKALNYVLDEISIRYELESFKNKPLFIILDEFQATIDTKKSIAKKLEHIASTCLEANIYLILANQKISQGISKVPNLNNNLLSRLYFRTDNRNNKILYNLDLSIIKQVGQCYLVNNEKEHLIQFGFLSDNKLKEIINYIANKQAYKQVQKPKNVEIDNTPDNTSNEKEEPTQSISKPNITDFEEIRGKIPNHIIHFLISKCLDSSLVSANRLRKHLNIGMEKAIIHCNELEKLNIIRKLDSNRGRIITDLGKKFLNYCQESTMQNETGKVKVIPLFNKN